MFDGDVDINLLAVAMAKTIAEGCTKNEILQAVHFLALLQTALRTYAL